MQEAAWGNSFWGSVEHRFSELRMLSCALVEMALEV